MRIILISEYNSIISTGGTETYLDMLVHALVKKKFEVIVFAQGNDQHEVALKEM